MKIIRFINICLCIFSFQMLIWAVPANKKIFLKQQPNNSVLPICLVGDESFSWVETVDKVILKENNDGFLTYAIIDSLGNISASTFVAKQASDRSNTDNQFVIEQKNKRNLVVENRFKTKSIKQIDTNHNSDFPSNNTINKQRGLVILVEFSDVQFSISNPLQEFTNQLNQKDYINQFGQKGSAKDYFLSNSMGQYSPDFITLGPVRLKEVRANYGADKGLIIDVNIDKFVVEALKTVSLDSVNLSEFDSDNDGMVDFVYFIYAGNGQNYAGSPTSTIWPHSFNLNGLNADSPVLQGLKFDNYACSAELSGANGTIMDGIGTFCHEFCHVLGLMDMYDTDYEGSGGDGFGLGEWSIMSSGSYNNDGYTPCNLNAFERASLNWLSLKELNEEQTIKLNDLSLNNEAYFINSKFNNEYFILENRQLTKWDEALPAAGMLIYHIDYNLSKWNNNTININPNHPNVKLLPADNELLIRGSANYNQYLLNLKGDPYPGLKNNTALTDLSLPNSKLWDGSLLNKPITSIKDDGGIISFDFLKGIKELTKPIVLSATGITSTGFIANWLKVKGANNYLLDVYSEINLPAENNVVETEGFQNVNNTVQTIQPEWTTSSNQGVLSAGNYGRNAPSLNLHKQSDFIRTPLIEGEIISFQFWCKPVLFEKTEELTINIYNGISWSQLDVFQLSRGISQEYSYSKKNQFLNKLPAGIKQIEIVANNKTNNILLDDISIVYDRKETKKKSYLNPYQNFETGDINSFQVLDVLQNITYYYSLRASSGSTISEFSNVIKVDLSLTGNISLNNNSIKVNFSGNGFVEISSNSEMAIQFKIIDISGKQFFSGTLNNTPRTIYLGKGVFILNIGGLFKKIIVN